MFVILTVMVILLACSITYAAPNLDKGFNGLKWGLPFSETTGLKLLKDNGSDVAYVREHDYKKFGEATFARIAYMFYEDHFEGVIGQTEGANQWIALRKTLTDIFGDPVIDDQGVYNWRDPFFKVILLRKDSDWTGTLFLTCDLDRFN